ncbi:hypothetical protein ATO8_18674 [Roseivivax marinus]|uniref:Uncharacterized protein n=1 Tax=Roseivivax marinus TaxID=1379903 RepID=W4HE71_9RHOB|nr:hypothetical protein [Roseivivax marinus]ETW11072.1 hypothetical protein ATO8_18674 [Roseivivax marinus]
MILTAAAWANLIISALAALFFVSNGLIGMAVGLAIAGITTFAVLHGFAKVIEQFALATYLLRQIEQATRELRSAN